MDELARWKKIIIKGGTQYDRSIAIKKWTYDRFIDARKEKNPVTTRNIQEWALQAAQQFRRDSSFFFQVSLSWANRFKQEYRIHQRKITRYVKPTEQKSLEELQRKAENFKAECREISGSFDNNLIINTDQMGCEYRAPVLRTLAPIGEKSIEVHLGDLNKTTHSYTVQYSITAGGKLLPKIFICLQEVSGKFGPRIQDQMNQLQQMYKNTYIVCSKSGKLSSQLFQLYLTEILRPYVIDNDFYLILDTWGGGSSKRFII